MSGFSQCMQIVTCMHLFAIQGEWTCVSFRRAVQHKKQRSVPFTRRHALCSDQAAVFTLGMPRLCRRGLSTRAGNQHTCTAIDARTCTTAGTSSKPRGVLHPLTHIMFKHHWPSSRCCRLSALSRGARAHSLGIAPSSRNLPKGHTVPTGRVIEPCPLTLGHTWRALHVHVAKATTPHWKEAGRPTIFAGQLLLAPPLLA
jgi:hypothetical protein